MLNRPDLKCESSSTESTLRDIAVDMLITPGGFYILQGWFVIARRLPIVKLKGNS